jgi:hypothetical protein
MEFHSILSLDDVVVATEEPAYFRDLNLDQIVVAVAKRAPEFDVTPFFYESLTSSAAIRYRQEIARDLEREDVRSIVAEFCAGMTSMREQLRQADELRNADQTARWFARSVETYCGCVRKLAASLALANPQSQGLSMLMKYLDQYVTSNGFTSLSDGGQRVAEALGAIQYNLTVGSGSVTVRRYESQPDYTAEITAIFEKFRQGNVTAHLTTFYERPYLNHVEEQILAGVATLFPIEFGALRTFAAEHGDFNDPLVQRFDREVRFYLAYLEHVSELAAISGLNLCYPDLAESDKALYATDTFDLALATSLANTEGSIVCNDFHLEECERVFVISGPNQGGKTTFARTFGQLHHLAMLGLPVPGSSARLFIFDRIFTHFERVESAETLRGKLQDDLIRVRDLLAVATSRSIIIMNEIFSSTTVEDAITLATKTFDRIIALDALCVCVTFLIELSRLGPSVVSLVSEVVDGHTEARTFKLRRAPAGGRSYAESIAEKYGLTYASLKKRLPS